MVRPVKTKPRVTIDELLGRGVPEKAKYFVNHITKELVPKQLPKNDDTVEISTGEMPPEMDNCVICDRVDYAGDNIIRQWSPTKPFFLMQIVSFLVSGCQYDYQIQPTEFKNIGKFMLVQWRPVEKQPGRLARTSKGTTRYSDFIQS